MTLRKAGTRKLMVENDEYRWIIAPRSRGIIVLVVEYSEEKGQKLEVHLESDINEFWIEFPYVEDLYLKIITPKEVAIIIAKAIELGWKAKQKGKPLVFNWNDNRLVMR